MRSLVHHPDTKPPTELPWRKDVVILPEGQQGVGVFATFADERRRHVATCHGWDANQNADLIAAAPELLEALRFAQAAMWDAHYGKGIAVEYARSVDRRVTAAINKAEGRA
jgi:basic membrane lipoprotein Med (substrate-binding protein (PBP1-ABC) superfamily)